MELEKDLIELEQLMLFLGYSDPRSVKKWCKDRAITIIPCGVKKYVPKHLLTQYIDNQLVTFVKGNQDQVFTRESQLKITEAPLNQVNKGSYQPDNEVISKYLAKYESASKPNTAKKATS